MSTDTAQTTKTPDITSDGFGTWRDQTMAFAIRYARELFRNKAVLFWTIAFPVGFYLLTVTVFIGQVSIPAAAMPYVKAGTAVTYGTFGAIVASLNSFGQQLSMDFEDHRYQLYRSLPIAPSADLAGRMIAGTALSLIAFAVVLVVAAATGGTFEIGSIASLLIVLIAMIALAVFWMTVAVLVSTAVQDARYASIITISTAMALFFLTGYNGGNPSVFQGPDYLLNWLPNTLPTRLIADQIVPSPDKFAQAGGLASPDPLIGTATLIVYALVALGVGLTVMRRVVYQQGGLS